MKIHIVHFDYALDWECDHEILGAYRKREDALATFKKKVDEIRPEWRESEVEIDTADRFEAQEKGAYSQNHHSVYVEEIELH